MYPLLIFVFLSACSYLIRLTCKIKMSKMSDFYIYVCICRYLCIHMYIYANLTYSHRHVLYVFPIYLSIYLSMYLPIYLPITSLSENTQLLFQERKFRHQYRRINTLERKMRKLFGTMIHILYLKHIKVCSQI